MAGEGGAMQNCTFINVNSFFHSVYASTEPTEPAAATLHALVADTTVTDVTDAADD